MIRLNLTAGKRVRLELPHSEVCMHMQVAGRVMTVELLERWGAQIYQDDGRPFSAPITPGEAGLYWDSETRSYYCYPSCDYCAAIDNMTGTHHCPVHVAGATIKLQEAA